MKVSLTRLNSDYTPIMLRPSEMRKIARGDGSHIKQGYYVQGGYGHDTDRIMLVKFTKKQIIAQVKDFNTGERVHRAGFKIRPRRSYKTQERMLNGFHKITDIREHFGRILSHESLHKAIRKVAGGAATEQFDEVLL